MSDIEIIHETVAGNDQAFAAFYSASHDYFFNYFNKYFSDKVTYKQSSSKTNLSELYQESAMRIWNKIVNGDLNENNLSGPLVNCLIGIGKGVLCNSTRAIVRRERFLDIYEEHFSDGHRKSGPSNADCYVEVKDESEKDDKPQNRPLRVIIGVKGAPMFGPYRHEEGLTREQIKKRKQFIKEKMEKLGNPCYGLLRATLWEGLKDNEIVEAYPSVFNTVGQIRMRRKRCIDSLRNMISVWEKNEYLYID